MTEGARERTLASHSRLFRILFPHLTILVHEPPAHLYASVIVLDSLEKSCTTKHVRVYLTRTRPERVPSLPIKTRCTRCGKKARGCCVDLPRVETNDNEAMHAYIPRPITADTHTWFHYRLLLKNCLNAR